MSSSLPSLFVISELKSSKRPVSNKNKTDESDEEDEGDDEGESEDESDGEDVDVAEQEQSLSEDGTYIGDSLGLFLYIVFPI